MANPELKVTIVGDSRKLQRTLKDTETQTKRWASRLEGISAGTSLGGRGGLASSSALLKGGGIALGAGIAAQQIRVLTDAASDLNEQISKSRQVFGGSSAAIEDWSRSTARSIGISQSAALEATGTFGNLFSTVNIDAASASEMSKRLVQLAADLASFNNADPSEVLDALRSGLIGEAEPLRRFGVLLSEARVQQRAMADTGKDTAKSLTNQEKAIARYEIILGDTSKAQGDFERTSGGLANQQRILKAQLADTQAEIGTKLLPVMLKLTEALNAGIGAAEGFASALNNIKGPSGQDILGGLFGGLKDGLQQLGLFHDEIDSSTLAVGKLGQAFRDASKDAAFLSTFQIPAVERPSAGLRTRPEEGVRGTQRPPAFGQPGFKVAPAPPVPLGPSPQQRNRIFDQDITRRLDVNEDARTLEGQIAGLKKIEGLIEKRIAATKDITRKLNLEDQVRAIRRQEASLADQIKENKQQAHDSSVQAFIDSLQLGVDSASLTKGLGDDLAALKKLEDGLKKQIAQNKGNLQLQQQLVTVEGQITDVKEQQRQNRLAAISSRQFRQLGLTDTGEQRTPGVANLKKQVSQLAGNIEGTKFDTPRLEAQLSRFRKVLHEKLVPKDVRSKLNDMLDGIRQDFKRFQDGLDKDTKPLTKTKALNTDRIVSGLGLDRKTTNQLRSRLSQFNTGGKALAAANGPAGAFGVQFAVHAPDVFLDGQKISTNTRRNNTVHARQNPKQKRGTRF